MIEDVEQEQLRVALKKAHEIRTKLEEFILHLSSIYREQYVKNSRLFDRDTEQDYVPVITDLEEE